MLSPITLVPLHIDINVIVLSRILEPRLALTKNGDLYYLAKETEKKDQGPRRCDQHSRGGIQGEEVSESREEDQGKEEED